MANANPMIEITVHRCRMHIVRHGGWGWGAGRRELAERAVRVLPELIAARIGELADSERDVEITQPVRINVAISKKQLLDLLASPAAKVDPMNAIAQKIVSQVDAAIQQSVLPAIVQADTEKQPLEQTDVAQQHSAPADSAPIHRSLIQMLIAWKQKGDLMMLLLRISEHTLKVWHDALMAIREIDGSALTADSTLGGRLTSEPDGEQVAAAETVESIVQSFARMASWNFDNRPVVLRCRIMAIVEIVLARGIPPGYPVVRLELDKHLHLPPQKNKDQPIPQKHNSSDCDQQPKEETAATEPGPVPSSRFQRQSSNQLSAAARNWEVHIPSALPFLILRPLCDIGYLETLGVALEAAGMNELAPAFATALAYKVLDVPERGWRRNPGSRRAAATMAGTNEEVSDSLLKELAVRANEYSSALDAVLTNAVLAGREPDQPLFLSRISAESDASFFLADAHGLFPVAIEAELNSLIALLDQCESPLLLIEASAADPQLLAEIHRCGHSFLIDVPPARGEHWRLISDSKNGRWWTNDAVTSPPKLARQARRLSEISKSATEFSSAIGTQRLAIPNTNDRRLEQTLTVATGVALSQIAWDLWRENEPTDPVLTLERFADLDANVQFTETEFRVRLPLGRRSIDLWEHGQMEDIVGVPWLGDRVVTFSKG